MFEVKFLWFAKESLPMYGWTPCPQVPNRADHASGCVRDNTYQSHNEILPNNSPHPFLGDVAFSEYFCSIAVFSFYGEYVVHLSFRMVFSTL